MWINDDYDLSVASEPGFGQVDLQSIVLHELGHWVPLAHDSNADAVMYSILAPQQIKREMSMFDVDHISEIYPCTLFPCVHPVHEIEIATPTSTPTPNVPTPTMTPIMMPTPATPTIVPTKIASATYSIFLPFVAK
jgi:hypothetical protein